jgi:hypothetical protein
MRDEGQRSQLYYDLKAPMTKDSPVHFAVPMLNATAINPSRTVTPKVSFMNFVEVHTSLTLLDTVLRITVLIGILVDSMTDLNTFLVHLRGSGLLVDWLFIGLRTLRGTVDFALITIVHLLSASLLASGVALLDRGGISGRSGSSHGRAASGAKFGSLESGPALLDSSYLLNTEGIGNTLPINVGDLGVGDDGHAELFVLGRRLSGFISGHVGGLFIRHLEWLRKLRRVL